MMRYVLRQCAVVCAAWLCAAPMVYAEPLNYGLVSLDGDASETIARDEMILTLSIQEEGKDRETIANIVTNRLNTVLQAAKRHSEFNTTLQSRQSWRSKYPRTDEKGKSTDDYYGWKDVALVQIKSKNLAALNHFAASVQKQAAIYDVQYMVSRNVMAAEEKRLTSQATERFKQRAEQITRDLGGSGYKIVQITIGGSRNDDRHDSVRLYGSIRAGYESSEAVPVQNSAPGETEINLNINGQIQVLGLH